MGSGGMRQRALPRWGALTDLTSSPWRLPTTRRHGGRGDLRAFRTRAGRASAAPRRLGLEGALAYLEGLRFTPRDLAYLRTLALFDEPFLVRLAALRFSGDVWAMAEGRLAFAGEPLLVVRAPLVEAQLVETFLLNALTFPTLVASKAARVAIACAGRPFVDFSARRDHGPDAALLPLAPPSSAAPPPPPHRRGRRALGLRRPSGPWRTATSWRVGDEEAAFARSRASSATSPCCWLDTWDSWRVRDGRRGWRASSPPRI